MPAYCIKTSGPGTRAANNAERRRRDAPLTLSRRRTDGPINELEREAVANSVRTYRFPRFMAPRSRT